MKKTDNIIFNKVEDKRVLSPDTFVLRLERKNVVFIPGQYLYVGIPNSNEIRQYSIYSGIYDPYLEILVRAVDKGTVSNQLLNVSVGDYLDISEPKGFFTLHEKEISVSSYLFVATGVGIAPFRSFTRSYLELNYKLIHGVRTVSDCFELNEYDAQKYISCSSRDNLGNYHGRVTDFLKENEMEHTHLYICGAHEMVKNVSDIMRKKDFDLQNIRSEIFY
ncbi:MAG: FAD-binding oxidoreductase [Salinivirgaceae bacterium]|nr:FAD-binding oxidoreductase [Salinivirgaceae bacterium]MDD4746154.1 FAD-binding oxidoreductase [Salinivirgaceae bacterium]